MPDAPRSPATVVLTGDGHHALEALCRAYAQAADDKDFLKMGSLFAENGELITLRGTTAGRDNITKAFGGLARYDSTFHLLGQMSFEPTALAGEEPPEPAGATGQVYCIAHHFTSDNDRVMYIRYHDRYVIDDDGNWKFAQRQLDVPATIDEPRS